MSLLFSNAMPSEISLAEVVSTGVAGIYIDAPFIQGSYASGDGVSTENFNSYSTGARTTISIGNGSMTGSYTVGSNSTYGGATRLDDVASFGGSKSNFATAAESGFTINFSTPVKYIGFYWTAGNAGNSVTFNSGGQQVATMTTAALTSSSFIGPYSGGAGTCPNGFNGWTGNITAQNGTTYYKKYYFGHPQEHVSTTPNCRSTGSSYNEPFAYVHGFAINGQDFDQLIFSGTGFEIDNITVSTNDVAISNRLVQIQEVTTSLTVGSSAWSIKGESGSDSSIETSGWKSESVTATSGDSLVLKHVLEISNNAAITPGQTSLLRATLNDDSSISCGSYSVVTTFTVNTTTSYETVTIVSSGTLSRTNLVRGYCYVWTKNPSYTIGTANLTTTNAVRPTAGAGTIFRNNLDSPILYLPKLPDIKIPTIIPVFPSNTYVKFPTTKVIQGSGQIQACFFEHEGSTLNGTWGTLRTSQNLGFRSSIITSNPFTASSTSTIPTLFSNLTISRINNSKFSSNRYLLIRIAPYLGSQFTTDCTGTGNGNSATFAANLWPNPLNVYLVTLKSINIKRTHSFVVLPRNGS